MFIISSPPFKWKWHFWSIAIWDSTSQHRVSPPYLKCLTTCCWLMIQKGVQFYSILILACEILLEHLRRWAEIERTVLEGSSSSLEGRTLSVEKILLTLSMLGNISCITCKLFGGFHKAIYWAQFYFHYICFHWLKLVNMHHISCHLW